MDRGAWQIAHWVTKRVRHDLVTKQQQNVKLQVLNLLIQHFLLEPKKTAQHLNPKTQCSC